MPRRRNFIAVVTAAVAASLIAVSRPVSACSQTRYSIPAAQIPCHARLPQGALVITDDPSTIRPSVGDEPPPLVEDVALSALVRRTEELLDSPPEQQKARAFRLEPSFSGSITIEDPSASDAAYERSCPIEIAIDVADHEPAPMPRVTATVDYVTGGSSGGGCSCSDDDMLHVDATKVAPYFVVYFGNTADETSTRSTPDAVGAFENSEGNFDITLGTDGERSGKGFLRKGKWCFSLAGMSATGKIGPRSPPECLNTEDVNDPHVQTRDEGFCVCTAPGRARGTRGSLGTLVVVAATLYAIRRRRRRDPRAQ